ncbi:hypothetical protein [Brevibacillus marinus]
MKRRFAAAGVNPWRQANLPLFSWPAVC